MLRTLSVAVLLLTASALLGKDTEIPVSIVGGKTDLTNVVVRLPIKPAPDGYLSIAGDTKNIVAQRTPTADGGTQATVLIRKLSAAEKHSFKLHFAEEVNSRSVPFQWKNAEGQEPELQYIGDRPILRYVRPTFDPKATPEKQKANANPTFKVYHHLFAADGKTLLTNGANGQYPHHRGIFYGFNTVTYGKQKGDIWHGWNGEHQAHKKTLLTEAGSAYARQRNAIDWIGPDKTVFAKEERDITVYNTLDGTLIDFNSELKTDLDKVRLDGDPQHAGFHFRANAEVEKNAKETYFLRPSGKGEKGKEENWVKGKGGPMNQPWNAMSFLVAGKRYTVLYIDHPDNPKEARQSERTYGRIGTYFEYDLTKDKPLKVKYRLWVQEGEMTVEQCQAYQRSFVDPPKLEKK